MREKLRLACVLMAEKAGWLAFVDSSIVQRFVAEQRLIGKTGTAPVRVGDGGLARVSIGKIASKLPVFGHIVGAPSQRSEQRQESSQRRTPPSIPMSARVERFFFLEALRIFLTKPRGPTVALLVLQFVLIGAVALHVQHALWPAWVCLIALVRELTRRPPEQSLILALVALYKGGRLQSRENEVLATADRTKEPSVSKPSVSDAESDVLSTVEPKPAARP